MKKYEISLNKEKMQRVADNNGYINATIVLNKEEFKRSINGGKVYDVGFITSSKRKDDGGIIFGNVSEIRWDNSNNTQYDSFNSRPQEDKKEDNTISLDMYGEFVDPDDIPF